MDGMGNRIVLKPYLPIRALDIFSSVGFVFIFLISILVFYHRIFVLDVIIAILLIPVLIVFCYETKKIFLITRTRYILQDEFMLIKQHRKIRTIQWAELYIGYKIEYKKRRWIAIPVRNLTGRDECSRIIAIHYNQRRTDINANISRTNDLLLFCSEDYSSAEWIKFNRFLTDKIKMN